MELLDPDSSSVREVGSESSLTLLAIDIIKEPQAIDRDIAKLQQGISTETFPMRDEIQAATPYLLVMKQPLRDLSIVDSLLLLMAEDRSYAMLVDSMLVVEVIDEAPQGAGTAQDVCKKLNVAYFIRQIPPNQPRREK